MTRNACLSLLVLLTISWSAHADIIDVSIPDLQMPYTDTAGYFTVEADITGSFAIAGYSLFLRLTPVGGASGVTFHSATGSSATDPDYIFPSSVGWTTAPNRDPLDPENDPMEIAGSDQTNSGNYTRADDTWNLATFRVDAALTAANIGDQYTISFVDAFTKSDFQGPDWWTSITDVDWTDTGTLTITDIPEPGSITMLVGLGLTSLFLYRRRRKR